MEGSGLGSVAGSGPDVIGAVLGLSEALRAGKGFVFNSCVFGIATADEASGASPAQPASAASRTSPTGQPTSAATPPRPTDITVRSGPTFLEVTSGSAGEGGPSSVVRLGLRQVSGADQVLGIVELQHLDEDFDAGLNSVAVELSVPEVAPSPRTALIAVKGFANPGGSGYAHFEAAILVSIGAGAQPQLATRPLFVSQAPPPQPGSGLFGQTVFVDSLADRVQLQLERRPLFNR